MPSTFTLTALGLNPMPNQLSAPEGSLTLAKNINIQRDNVVESRRGFKIFGNAMGSSSDRAKQLISYKLRILRHFASTLQFDSTGDGDFLSFAGTVEETAPGLRIKSIEANGNLYFTTADGIKKISALTAADFTTASDYVTLAGAVKAVDITGMVNYDYGDQSSFLTQDSAVAYRVVWGYRDANNVLILGTPSQRIEVYNPLLTLLLRDYMVLLGALDNIGTTGPTLIDDADYVSTLGLGIDAAASTLRTNLIALASKLDNDIVYADNDGAPTGAPLEVSTSSITTGVCTVNFASGTATDYFVSGSKIFLSGFTPGTSGTLDGAQVVASVTASSITFNTSATGVVTVGAGALIVSNEYRDIAQPTTQSTPATDQELVELQDYILLIQEQLIAEPDAVIDDALSAIYIDVLTVTTASDVTLTITIPDEVVPGYFFQIYRSAVFTATGVQVLSTDVVPNDELQLVYEAFPTTAELAAKEVIVTDVVPDAFRGANLYTNASTGEGILQANDVPPFAKDINTFKNSTFYANTRTRNRKEVSLLGVQNMITDALAGDAPTITIASESGFQTYTFVVGVSEEFDIVCGAGSTLAASGTADYFDVHSGNDIHAYRFWYKIGTATEPAAGGFTLVPIVALTGDTATQIAERTRDALNILSEDFTATNVTATVSVVCNVVGYTTDAVDGTTGFTFTNTVQGVGESVALKQVLLSNDISPARAVELTSQSLARVMNQNASEQIYVYYTSGAQEVPGKMIFESRSLNGEQFTIVTNNANTGNSFNPTFAPSLLISSISTGSPTTMLVTTTTAHGLINLDTVYISGSDSTPSIDGFHQITYVSTTTFRVNATITIAGTTGSVTPSDEVELSSNDEFPNRVYFSKPNQPEAVPVLNFFDVGARDREILRIYPLRDSLFVFKEDGLYRISGEGIPFNLALFDSSCVLLAADSLSSVDNTLYGWTDEGISSISESGTKNASRPIDIELLPLASASYTNFPTATWGVGYDSDKSYTVFTVKKTSDTYAKQGFKYNSLTNTWTNIDKDYICGIINFNDDKMYVGAGDTNYIEIERKDFSRTDFADREYDLEIQPNSSSTEISVDSVVNVEIGDVIVQEQTLSIYTFNMLLKKLDIDPGVPSTDYFADLEASMGDNLRDKLVALAQKLDADGLQFTNYEASIDELSAAITVISTGSTVTITSTAHGLLDNRKVLIASTNSVPTVNGEFIVDVQDANTFNISPGFTVTTAGTSGTFSTLNDDFEDLKACFNIIVDKLNIDTTVAFTNYSLITQNTIQEALVVGVNSISKILTIEQEIPFIEGALTSYKAIECEVIYSPHTFGGDPITLKHMREAQMLFETLAFSGGTLSFSTDLLPKFEDVEFTADGNGIFGFTSFGEGFFGGASNSAPIRTYIPRNCQRCRFMVVKFNHKVAREKFSLFGITLTGETELSTRAYR